MKTNFVITSNGIERSGGVNVAQMVQDCMNELTGGYPFDRQATSDYLDEQWRPSIQAWDETTGEVVDIRLPDDLWIEYREDILDEVERQTSPF